MYFCTQKLKHIKEMRNLTWAIAVVAMLCSCSGKNTKKQGSDAASDAALVEVTVKYAALVYATLPISVWWMWVSMTISLW